MDDIELLWRYYLEQREAAHHRDQQRTSLAGIVVSLSGAAFAIASIGGLGKEDVYVLVFTAILGLFGALSSFKLYERAEQYYWRARVCVAQIKERAPGDVLATVQQEAERLHMEKLGRSQWLDSIVRVHVLWVLFHLLISILSIAALMAIP